MQQLNIWEGTATIAEVADLEKAKERIAYFYANPAQDGLTESIEQFPGYSSFKAFLNCKDKLHSFDCERYPFIRLPSIPKLPSRILGDQPDRGFVKRLWKNNKKVIHTLERRPNEWMKHFGVADDEEAASLNADILLYLREKEEEAAIQRCQPVMGARRLRSQPIMKEHEPKKRSRKVFVLASTASIRKKIISEFRAFCKECRLCYLACLRGDFSLIWPPGAFKPPLPPNANVLAEQFV